MCLMGFFKIWCEKCSVQLWLRGFWFSTVLQEWFSCIRQMISFVPREEWRLGVGIYASWSGLHWRNTLPLGRGGRGLLLIRRSVKGVQRRVAGVNSDFKYWDAKDVFRRKVCVCVCVLCDPEDRSLPDPLSMEFSRQEYWSRLPFPTPRIFLIQGSNRCPLHLLHWQGDSLPTVPPGKPRRAALGVKCKGRNRIHLKGWKFEDCGNSLVVQWLGLHTLTAEGLGSISGQASKFPQVAQCEKKKKS